MRLLHYRALERRVLSGFLSGTPTADLIELPVLVSPKAYLGPVAQIGFLDLTDRIHNEGLYEQFVETAFSPHTSRGRIFGLPHDLHPSLLAYRADLAEAAGISAADIAQTEAWDDYFRVMAPLMEDLDGDGRPDRYLLAFSEVMIPETIGLLLQNGGTLFDEADRPNFASERNAYTLATLVTWVVGTDAKTTFVEPYSAAGLKQHLDGIVVGSLVSDIRLGRWKGENPRMSGKLKLMPIPAWEKGGRRTTVLTAGTMIGINERSPHTDAAWEMAKTLYTSPAVAEATFASTMVLSPLKALWSEPFYHQPGPFYSNQSVGTLLIEQAPHVPLRSASPYNERAQHSVSNVLIALREHAETHEVYEIDALAVVALQLLEKKQAELEQLISRNVFHETAD